MLIFAIYLKKLELLMARKITIKKDRSLTQEEMIKMG